MKKFKRKTAEVDAIQWFKIGDHAAVSTLGHGGQPSIITDFGSVQIHPGDWVVEIDGKIKVLKDTYFKKHYTEVKEPAPTSYSRFVYDCE